MRNGLRRAGSWLLAAIVTAAIGSIIQTQYNMSAIVGLGAPVTLAERLAASTADLIRFGPVWATLVALAFLPAFPVAAGLARLAGFQHDPVRRQTLFGIAGLTAVLSLILIMNTLAPMTPVAATRSLAGVVTMALPGLAGGWLFARLSWKRP